MLYNLGVSPRCARLCVCRNERAVCCPALAPRPANVLGARVKAVPDRCLCACLPRTGLYATQRRDHRTLASDLYPPDLLLQASTWNKLQCFVLLSPCCCTYLTDVLQQVLVSVLILRQLFGARMISMSTALCCQSGALFENIPRWHPSPFKDPCFVSSIRTTLATSSLGRDYDFAAFVSCLVPNDNLCTRESRLFGTNVHF